MTHNFINYSKLFCHIFVLLTKLGSAFFAKNEMCKSCANMNDFIFPLQKYQYKSSAEIGKLHISICANQRSYTFCYLQKKKFASQIKRAIFVTLFAVIFFACILCITKFNFMQKKHKIR